jgi:Protein of unknown function (DUF1194)
LVRAFALLATLFVGGPANAACHLALALALDVSSSVDDAEYQLQRDGLASALLSENVQDAFFAHPGDWVSLAVYEWSGRYQHAVVLDWIEIRDPEALFSAAEKIAAAKRSHSEFPTAMGYALGYSASLFAKAPRCDRATLDVSGDGVNNDGFAPHLAYSAFPLNNVTVNGLVIGGADPEVQQFYLSDVIRGPGAFVVLAQNYHAFEEAMESKLIREIGVMTLGMDTEHLPHGGG